VRKVARYPVYYLTEPEADRYIQPPKPQHAESKYYSREPSVFNKAPNKNKTQNVFDELESASQNLSYLLS